MVFSDGITDGLLPSVIPSAIPSVKVPHHCSDSISDSIGDYLSLNPSIILSVKSSDVTTLLHISRQTVYPVGETVGIYRRFCRRV